MSTKKRLFAIVMIGLFSQSFLWTAQYKMETLFEKGFDAEIEDVIFDSYEKDDAVKFYPKIVILKHLDRELSQSVHKFYKKEVKIYNSNGDVVSDLWFPFRSRIGCSNNGNYFYVWNVVREKPEPYNPAKVYETRIKESSFVVYNDKGEILWKKSPYEPIYDVAFGFFISPKDGSVFKCESWTWYIPVSFYDTHGNETRIRTADLYGYADCNLFEFNETWEFGVVLAHKYPDKILSGESAEPRILLVDSLLNPLWDNSLDENIFYRASISRNGSYIYASAYTMAKMARHSGLRSMTGYLYNKNGNLLMKISNGAAPIAFSSNEKYLLAKSRTPTDNSPKSGIIFIDIEAKKVLFENEWHVTDAVIASDGTMALIGISTPEPVQDKINKMSVAEARAYRRSLYIQSIGEIGIFDRDGNILFGSDGYELLGDKLTLKILDLDGTNLIFGITDRTQNKANIISIKFKGE
ncbi:hypothetical protein KA005_42305 [bacterium]|nr:hypothetical protein [bacterium]